MVDGHNWNQIDQVLLHENFQLVQNYTEGIISYQDTNGHELVINKSNDMSCEYLNEILDLVDIDYDEFKRIYHQEYSKNK